MTKEALAQILENEIDRTAEKLKTLDPETKEYAQLVSAMRSLGFAQSELSAGVRPIEGGMRNPNVEKSNGSKKRAEKPAKAEAEPAPAETPQSEPEPEEETPPEEATAAEAVSEKEKPEISLLEVRAALTEARKKGVDVNALIRESGYPNLSSVPPEYYPTLLAGIEVE